MTGTWTPDPALQAALDATLPTLPRGYPAALVRMLGQCGWTRHAVGGTRLALLNPSHPGVLLKLAYRPSGRLGNAQEARHWQDLLTHARLSGQAHPQQALLFPVLWVSPGDWLLAQPAADLTLQDARTSGELSRQDAETLLADLYAHGLSDVVPRNIGRLAGQWRQFDYGDAPRWAHRETPERAPASAVPGPRTPSCSAAPERGPTTDPEQT